MSETAIANATPTYAESAEALLRERWEAVKKELSPDERRVAARVERLLDEFDPPIWAHSRAHFVQAVVASSHRVPATPEQRRRLAQVTRRIVLGGRPEEF